MNWNNILVALDDHADEVINTLSQFNLTDQHKIVLVHVMTTFIDRPSGLEKPHTYHDDLPYRQIERKLEEYQNNLPYPSLIEIVNGDPATEIVRLAYIHKIDLIIVGSRGLKGVNRIIQGSTSSQVVNDAPCSVFVVKLPSAN